MLTEKELKSAETFKSVNKALENPEKVYKLSLRGTGKTSIDELPETLQQFKNLQFLDINQSPVKALPDWIGELTNLQTLRIDETLIEEIPASIGKLQNLHTLEAGYNTKLTKGIAHIYKLKNLKRLTISGVVALLKEIQNLTQLEYLGLDKVSDKSKLECVFGISALKELYISGNKLTKIPAGISQLTKLETLEISCSQVFEIAEELADTTIKNFSYNSQWLLQYALPRAVKNKSNYSQIFEILSTIKSLQKVELINNEIEILDKNIGLLKQIKELNLANNNLLSENSFPKEMESLVNLKKLKIVPNALKLEVIINLQNAMPHLKIIS